MTPFENLLLRADEIYSQRKGYIWDGYTAPECRPRIQSDQVLAAIQALMEHIEEQRYART